ncbi:uncharacterized protein LOC117586586 [Drosophila guanche]|uniref:Uncharacterized protein n=1 Tax=Drosophila guanche TaxID=7266 RepID=A0A3B0KGK8_DROGU|nr:uncharacterized protein LOC117586586 [Drosophila guanche]SPP84211.1 Hypothetical predicted protein [Drosophila guanche]
MNYTDGNTKGRYNPHIAKRVQARKARDRAALQRARLALQRARSEEAGNRAANIGAVSRRSAECAPAAIQWAYYGGSANRGDHNVGAQNRREAASVPAEGNAIPGAGSEKVLNAAKETQVARVAQALQTLGNLPDEDLKLMIATVMAVVDLN